MTFSPPPHHFSLCLSLPSAQCAGEWYRIANRVITATVQAFVVFLPGMISSLQQGKIKLLVQLKAWVRSERINVGGRGTGNVNHSTEG